MLFYITFALGIKCYFLQFYFTDYKKLSYDRKQSVILPTSHTLSQIFMALYNKNYILLCQRALFYSANVFGF